jgi:hypothetical protein
VGVMTSVRMFVVALVHPFEALVEGFPALRAEHGALALKAVALLPSCKARTELCRIVFAGAAKSTLSCRAAQAHTHGMVQQRRSDMMQAQSAMSAMSAVLT